MKKTTEQGLQESAIQKAISETTCGRILSSFTKKEFNDFVNFLPTGFLSRSKGLVNFAKLFEAAIPNKLDTLTKGKLAVLLGKDPSSQTAKSYVDRQLNRLKEGLELFLVMQSLNRDEGLKEVLLLKAFYERDMDWAYARQLRSSEHRPKSDFDSYLIRIMKSGVKMKMASKVLSNPSDFSPEVIVHDLDRYFARQRLLMEHHFLDRKSVFENPGEIVPIEKLHDLFEANWVMSDEVSSLMLMTLDFFRQGDFTSENYMHIKNKLMPYLTNSENEYREELFGHLLVYLINVKSRFGDEFRVEESKLHTFGIESGIMLSDGKLSFVDAYNPVSTYCILGDVEQAQEFIDKYSYLLNYRGGGQVAAICLGTVYFHKGEFQETIDELNKFQEWPGEYLNLAHRSLRVRTYFELNEQELLSASIESFRKYLQRHPYCSEALKEGFLNFISGIKRLNSHRNSQAQLDKIESDLKGKRRVSYRMWLLKKLNEFRA